MDEDLSAWVDEELDADAAERLYARLEADEPLAQRWDTYHLIGDALRGTGARGIGRARFADALRAEPTVLAPVAAPRRAPAPRRRELSRLASVAAGVSAVGFVGWMALPLVSGPVSRPVTLVQTPSPALPVQVQIAAPAVPTPVEPPKAVADYLLAHNRWSHSFTGAVPYVRIVSEQARGAAKGAQ